MHPIASRLAELLPGFPWPAAVLDRRAHVVATDGRWLRLGAAGELAGPRLAVGCSFLDAVHVVLDESPDQQRALDEALHLLWSGQAAEREVRYGTAPSAYALRLTRVGDERQPFLLLAHLGPIPEPSAQSEQLARADEALRITHERLREAQRLQRGILDSIPDMAWLKDVEGRFLAVNKKFEAAAGCPRDDVVGKTDLDFWERRLAEQYRADDRLVMSSGESKRIEEPFVDQHGEQRWIETVKVAITDDRGRVIGTAGIARDITERKQALAVLRRSHAELERLVEQRTRELSRVNDALRADIAARERIEEQQRRLVAILEATTDFVGMADVTGRCIYLNRAGRRMLGIGEADDITQTWIRDCHPEWAAQLVLEQGVPAAMAEGVWSGETAMSSRSGREIPVSQLLLVHRDAHGEAEFISTIARDMSERRLLETQLLQSQKMEAIGRLAGGIAHDFNNLLTVILGYCELTLSRLPAHDPQHENVQFIQSAAERAASLTRQLLAFARKQIIEPRAIDLNHHILEVDGMLRRLIGADIELVTMPGPDVRPVRVDPGQLQQILVNLALNARDAMPGGGTLTIQTANVAVVDAGSAQHHGVPLGEYVHLLVSDTGTGMTREVLDHVFEPFFTTKGLGKGTGLGLATCYAIVQQAGGHILVDSEPGKGTSFRVYWPRVSGDVVEPESQKTVRAELRGTETILLVEDEPVVRKIAERALTELGYRVLVAERGSEALAIAEAHPGDIHLLLTDVIMPKMSGRQVADAMKSLRPQARILYMSGYTDAAISSQGTLERGVAFIAKPFTPQSLVLRVRQVLDHRRERAADGVGPGA